MRDGTGGRLAHSLRVSPEDVPELVSVLEKAGRTPTGYAIEGVLITLSDLGEPDWAKDLDFDREATLCVVRCARRGPLRVLVRRLERRLPKRAVMRRIVDGLPRE